MNVMLSTNWGALAVRGAAAMVFGALTMLLPLVSLTALIAVFAAYCLVDGGVNVIGAVRAARGHARWWALLAEGLVSIAVGVLTLMWPGLTALALLYLIAVWALLTGILEIAAAIRLRKVIRGEWLLALSGAASIVLGGLLIAFPGPGALGLVMVIGAYAIVFGALLLGASLRIRSWNRTHPTTEAPAPA